MLDCPPGEDERLVVDRATIVCRRDASLIKHKVAAYWDGLHNLYATSATSLE